MNRQYRRRIEKMQKKEYAIFVKRNKDFLDAIKGDNSSQETLKRIKELLDNYGQQEQTLEGGEKTFSPEEERTKVKRDTESSEQNEVGN